MKTFNNLLIVAAGLLFAGFLFFSPHSPSEKNITNYYYFQGEKFFFQERTDVIFVTFKEGVTDQQAREVLSAYSSIDLGRSGTDMVDDNFIRLTHSLSKQEYTSLVDQMKSNDVFEDVNYAFSPAGINDEKTFYGLNDYLILQFKPNYSRQQVDQINSSKGVDIVSPIDVSGGLTFLAKVNSNSVLNAMEVANSFYEDGLVNYSEPSMYVTNVLCDTVNDPFYPMQWSLRNTGSNVPTNPPGAIPDADMDVDSAWNVTTGDSTVIIAILDTGVDTTHPDISRVIGYDFANMDGNPNDDGNHGTACAGIAAAIGNNNLGVTGVAYRCKIMPIKIINSAGSIPGYHVAAFGTIWAYQHGAAVLSNSWGFTGGASSLMLNALNDAARFGRNGKGSVLCYASGNENTSPMRFPAISPLGEMVVVGGVTPCNTRKHPTDGCSGETWGASFGPTLDIVAPCVKIYTTDRVGAPGYSSGDYYATFNGTSSATPNAAGVIALIISANPDLTRNEIEAIISLSAEKVGSYSYTTPKEYGNWNNEMGYGRINARYSLEMMNSLFDKVKPEIYHDNPVLPGTETGPRIVSAIITDNNMLAAGPNAPRLYYRVDSGAFNFVNATTVVQDTFKFTIPGQVLNSTINYYFAAQDTAGTPNMNTLPEGGSGVNPPGSTPPAQHFTYRVGTFHIQQSTTTPKVCPNNSTIYDTITLSGFPTNALVVDLDVKLSVSNRDNADVDLFLFKGALQSELTTDNGGSSDSYVNTIFDDEATTPITSGTSPFTGRYRPETPLTAFDNTPLNGTWVLRYTDDAATGFNSSLDEWRLEITYALFMGITHTTEIPSKYGLEQNYPNPFNPATVIKYGLPRNSMVKLTLFDITGKEVSVLVNENQQAGTYEFTLDINSMQLSSGVYFYKLQANEFVSVKKMVLIK
jgi:subtilisin family serine protease